MYCTVCIISNTASANWKSLFIFDHVKGFFFVNFFSVKKGNQRGTLNIPSQNTKDSDKDCRNKFVRECNFLPSNKIFIIVHGVKLPGFCSW